jgi:serine/threonine protein phosphatase PrpC
MDAINPIHVDGLTDIGNRRQNNEDAWWAGQLGGRFFCMEPETKSLDLDVRTAPVLLLVCDGVGGANAGEVASQLAINLIAQELGRLVPQLSDDTAVPGILRRTLQVAHDGILAKAREPSLNGMGATLSLLCLTASGHANWAQAGDSRIYLCRAGRLRQLSRDHSPVGRLRQQGVITEEAARQHPQRNQIDQSLGDTINPFQPDLGREAFQTGDVFLVCSDGLSDGLWDRQIEEALAAVRSPADLRPAVQQLVEEAKQASGRDNITAAAALVGVGASAGSPDARRSFWRNLIPV